MPLLNSSVQWRLNQAIWPDFTSLYPVSLSACAAYDHEQALCLHVMTKAAPRASCSSTLCKLRLYPTTLPITKV